MTAVQAVLPRLRSQWRIGAILAVGAVVVTAVGPLAMTDKYQTFIITTIAIDAIVALSVSALAGLAGIWSVGHMAFVAVGAYSVAFLSQHDVSLPVIVLFAMVLSSAVGFLIGLTAGRFEVLYLAILTLALALVANEVIGQWTAVTGGDLGTAVNAVSLFGSTLDPITVTELSIGAATVLYLVTDLVSRGRTGRRWLAIKNRRIAAVAIGLNPALANATAFAASAAMASVAGVLLALQIGYISADTFTLTNGINFIVASVVGGVGSIVGALVGTTFIVEVPEQLRSAQDVQVVIFGAATIAVLLLLPEGIVPGIVQRTARLLTRGRGRPEAGGSGPVAQTERIEQLLTRRHEVASVPGADLHVEGVTVRFGGLTALQDVALDIGAGEIVALIGPNGAGKTTFLNVLGGYVKPEPGGVVRYGGHDLLRTSAHRRTRLGIARTFQHAELFSELRVREAVMLAAQRDGVLNRGASPHDLALETLSALGLQEYADDRPATLPFGIQKRVDIARALAVRPSLLVMDEPFSGLDLREQEGLHELILGFRRAGVSVLLVDHAVQEVLSLADRVVVLDYGRVIAHDVPREIQRSEAVKEAYFGVEATA